ncbi:MAG: chromosome segregation protein SMC [Lachnospiraceae bacterium]|nr:chromosome segregation protein SMC [Lachnospiraceae bacterium]
MFLKSIEIQGFKSFANKIVFQFHNGITGIVGPNGSGKSNVADAVRWVLGEQSVKQLRGGSMQDVIFAGTELRKPLNYAYVAITLDNSDHQLPVSYDEVTVARRLYRSGESEYLLNGSACRLKDVNELFYDTGIGKEGYSIIGQGQIDRILSGRPDERRELFDEAAGIVKFKRRKAAAIKKLENEKANLVRVNDILSELERQIGPLERQSEKAREYLKQKEALKTLDVNAFLLEHNRLKTAVEDLESKLGVATAQHDEAKAKFEGVRDEYDRVQTEIEELEKQVEEARSALGEADITRAKLENQIEILREQIRSAGESEIHFADRKKALENQIAKHLEEREQISKGKDGEEEQAKKIEQEANDRQKALDDVQAVIAELNEKIETGKKRIIEELNNRAAIKAKISRFDSMNEQYEIRRAELNSRLLRVKSDEEAREDTIKSFETAFEKASEKLTAKQNEEKETEEKVASFREELTSKDEQLRKMQEQYHQENSRLQALNDIAEQYEGYGQSVKKVMERKKDVKGIVGTIADIIKVDKKYETAIENALGGNVQNIVTKDEDTAKKLIAYLKEGKLGRATFLPMDAVKAPEPIKAQNALKEPGVLGLAHELVDTDKSYETIIEYLLGRFIVVDDVDNATKLARKYNYTLRIVTLEGELLMPGGSISGGSFKHNANFLGKSREITDLKKSVEKLAADIEKIRKEIDEARDNRNKLRADLERIKMEVQNLQIDQNTARVNLQAARERMEEESENAQSLQSEQMDIENNLREASAGKAEGEAALKESEKIEEDTQNEINELSATLEEKQKEESEALARVSEWEIEVQKMRQARSFQQANLNRIDDELAEEQGELEQIEETLKSNQEAVVEKNEQIEEIQKTIAASFDDQSAKEQLLKDSVSKKEELSKKQKSFFEDREKLSDEMNALDKEVYRLTTQKERSEEAIAAQINYMWEEYEITLSDAAAIRDESMTDLTVMKRDIAEIKDKIKKLGDVNVNAIEEYKEVSERYETMKTQHDDLIEAAETLEKLIAELDESMRKQFTEKFAEINREYDKVFKELFGGGKGTLEIQSDEDILEAGILISAQPPGKKLQNMMQLSGGEKALSAIALLFAIQNLKPSPFALLDEIEAALDDSNVGRFAKYLHKLTKNTQFIVITHRRGTMEQVDRLYGITMQEKGVSALVSVNLIENELDN